MAKTMDLRDCKVSVEVRKITPNDLPDPLHSQIPMPWVGCVVTWVFTPPDGRSVRAPGNIFTYAQLEKQIADMRKGLVELGGEEAVEDKEVERGLSDTRLEEDGGTG